MTIERSVWILCLEVIFLSFHTVLSLVSADVACAILVSTSLFVPSSVTEFKSHLFELYLIG